MESPQQYPCMTADLDNRITENIDKALVDSSNNPKDQKEATTNATIYQQRSTKSEETVIL